MPVDGQTINARFLQAVTTKLQGVFEVEEFLVTRGTIHYS
jgi:hypothetical protein